MNKILMMLKKGWNRLQAKSNEWFDRYLFATEKRDLIDDRDFIADADNVIMEQSPRGARLLIRTAALAVFVLILWAAFAKIDEVTKGDGRVIPSSELQVIQSLDGGMVKSILVHEGQAVKKGDLLISRFNELIGQWRS